MLRAGGRQASLIAYSGWKMLGIYPEVKGKTNLHPVSVDPVHGCVIMDFEGFSTLAHEPERLISMGITIKGIVQRFFFFFGIVVDSLLPQ